MKKNKPMYLLYLVTFIMTIALAAQAQITTPPGLGKVAVTRATLTVAPAKFDGQCPQTLQFTGSITVVGSAPVKYTWESSDGGTYPTYTVNANNQTVSVNTTWQLSASYSGWKRLHVLSPQSVESNQAQFQLTCARVTTPPNLKTRFWAFDNKSFVGYDNTPTLLGDGTLVLTNTSASPASNYQTGVGAAPMPAYSVGDQLEWAIYARTTTGSSAELDIGVQNGGGDINDLTIGQGKLPPFQVTNSYRWIVSPAATVDIGKGTGFFYITNALGQTVQVRQVVLGDPVSVAAHIRSTPNP